MPNSGDKFSQASWVISNDKVSIEGFASKISHTRHQKNSVFLNHVLFSAIGLMFEIEGTLKTVHK
jgi:hypothetical protein